MEGLEMNTCLYGQLTYDKARIHKGGDSHIFNKFLWKNQVATCKKKKKTEQFFKHHIPNELQMDLRLKCDS